MKELITRTWCDHCDAFHEGDRTPSVVHRVIAIDGRPRELDLCEVGDKDLIEKLLQLLESHGQPYEGDLGRLERFKKQVANGGYTPSTGRPVAGTDLAPGELTPGGKPMVVQCPACELNFRRHSFLGHADHAHAVARPKQPAVCPDCGYKNRDSSTPQGMGTHRSKSHGYDPIAETITRVQKLADGLKPPTGKRAAG